MAFQPRLHFSEAERPLGERLLKVAAETDRVEGYQQPHAQELARLAEKLGQRLGLRGVDLSALKFAALAHDIGERQMKRDYLLRSAGLSWEEQLDLWRHPIIGEQAAAELKLPRLSQLLIRWHHEWWNGQGYPDGLAGTAIPLGARVLRVVDTYLALLSDRPHRAQLDADQVEQFVTDQAGVETDPQVVKAFLALLAEEKPVIETPLVEVPAADETNLASYEPPAGAVEPPPFVSAWDNARSDAAAAPTLFDAPQMNFEEPAEPNAQPNTEIDAWATQEAPIDEALRALKNVAAKPVAETNADVFESSVENEAAPVLAEAPIPAALPAADSVAEALPAEVPEPPTTSAAPEALSENQPAAAETAGNSITTFTHYEALETNPFPPDEIASPSVSAQLIETPLRIVSLSEAPDHFWPVAQWIYDQWWATPDNSVQVVSEQLKEHLADHPLPCTLVAVVGDQPVGSLCLLENAGPTRPAIAPCLAALFVLPEFRHRGVATRLLEAGYAKAKAQGVSRVYFTVPEQEDFLARRGWQVLEPAVGSQTLLVLYKD